MTDLPELPSDVALNAMQYPPCAVYDVTNGAGTLVFRILSLDGSTLVSTPPRTWLPWKEHWFSLKGTDLASKLAVGPIKMTLLHRSPQGIDATIQSYANALAVTSTFKFQIYSKGLLSQQDWIPGTPSSFTNPNFYFVEQNAPKPERAARPLYEINPADSTLLSYVNWFTLDKTVAGYLVGAPDGAYITLDATGTGAVPTNGWYFRAP